MVAISIPGGSGSVITFTLNNQSGAVVNYAEDFAAAVAIPVDLSFLPVESSVAGGYNIFNSGDSISTTLTQGSQYTYIAAAAPSFIYLDASNETLLTGALTTIIEGDSVGGERVVFTDGVNSFIGSASDVGGDTIAGGSGYDNIFTGGGATTVFGGSYSTIVLNDTAGAGGDIAVLSTGMDTVFAYGAADTIFAGASGLIVGGSVAGFTVTTADDPSGALPFTVIGGMAGGIILGSSGTDVTFSNAAGDAGVSFAAGNGNETLDGSTSAGNLYFFGSQLSDAADTVVGGSGYDFFATGIGTEDLTAGSGLAAFDIASVSGAAITINDFGGSDSLHLAGLTLAQETAVVDAGTAGSGGFTIDLGSGSTVTFTNITSASGLTNHLN